MPNFLHLLVLTSLLCFSYASTAAPQVGAARSAHYLPQLQQLSVGLVTNHSALVEDMHILDMLLHQGVNVHAIYPPEHGFRGQASAGETVADAVDATTGIAVLSLYGPNKKPSPQMLAGIEVLVFDMQDVGARFYTYLSTLHYVLEAAAEQGLPVIVLDRPNPNGRFVAGPLLDPTFRSFVGMHPIPLLHGMTLGELALMIKGEGWIADAEALRLQVVPMSNYDRHAPYALPVPPSPNLPNAQAVQLYPSLCLFEGTAVSLGRGTDWPFQLVGHDKVPLGEWRLTPRAREAARQPKFVDTPIFAADLRTSPLEGVDLSLLIATYQRFAAANEPFFTHPAFFDKLAGSDKLRRAIEAGQTWQEIEASWQADIARFLEQRRPYLLYDD